MDDLPASQTPTTNTVQSPSAFVTPPLPVASDLASREFSSLNMASKRSNLKAVLLVTFIIAVVAGGIALYFAFLPKIQTKTYLAGTSRDFGLVQDSIKQETSQIKVGSNSLEMARGYFFSYSQLRSYKGSQEEISRAIDNLQSTQNLVKKAGERRKKLHATSPLGELNKNLDEYYTRQSDGVGSLLAYENYQLEIARAIGDDYNREMARIFDVYGANSQKSDVDAYFKNLSKLADAAESRLKSLNAPPSGSEQYYKMMLEAQSDIVSTIKDVSSQLSTDSAFVDASSSAVLAEFSKRQDARNSKIDEINTKSLVDSQAKAAFARAVELEVLIRDGFKNLSKRYSAKINI